MARYILIDQHSGYIFGDTADYAGGADLTPVEAARALDASIGEHGRAYFQHEPFSMAAAQHTGGYFVHRADGNGSDLVPVVHDGQDADTITAVVDACPLVAFVAIREGSPA